MTFIAGDNFNISSIEDDGKLLVTLGNGEGCFANVLTLELTPEARLKLIEELAAGFVSIIR